MSHYPSFKELLQSQRMEPGSPLLEVRRSLYSTLSGIFWFLITAAIVVTLDAKFPNARFPEHWPVLSYISLRWLSLVPAVILLEVVRRFHNDLYVFERDQITHFRGRLSLNYAVPIIKYNHIRAVTVIQDVMGRLFNFGNVALGTASEAGYELVLRGVRDPQALAALVDDIRCYNEKPLLNDAATPLPIAAQG